MAAKIVILPRMRLGWHLQMAGDVGLSHVSFRFGVWIGKHFNNKTGKTFIGYERIARDLGLSRATVATAIKELKDCDHIKVESGGGRCVANEYRMTLNTVQNSERYDDADTVQNQDPNRPESWTTTLKLSSKANSIGARSSSQSRIRHSEEATKDNRGVSKFKFGSENWNAWLACSGTPPSAHRAFCNPSASATKLSPPSTTWACSNPEKGSRK